ncbi:MAG: M20/M25/M40 family metallo-hydrolase [Acidobacteriota bacterium]
MAGFIERLVVAESPSLLPEAQQQVLEILTGALTVLGYRVRRIRGRQTGDHLYAVPAGRRRGSAAQLLLGHCDTVWPLGSLQQMPFEITGEIMRGPGIFDMKAGLAQMIYALEALRALALEPAVAPVVFINSDEEIGSDESSRYIRSLARRVDRAFVLEPALSPAGKLKTQRKGVGQFTVVATGRAAHAGLDPEKGASAVLELSHQIQRLFALSDREAGVSVNVGLIAGGVRPNVIAPEAEAIVDVRVPSEPQARRLEKAILGLQAVTEGVALEVTGSIARLPLAPTPRNRALWDAAVRLARELGLELEEGLAGGASDGNTTSQFTATLDGLGAVGDGAHADHEFVCIQRCLERCALLALLLLEPPLC